MKASPASGDATTPPTAAIHFGRLDAVRGLAAQPVLLSHALGMLFPYDMSPLTYFIRWSAHLSVIVFFVLSGFVIVQGIAREIGRGGTFNWFDFGIRRVARIYPPYLIAVTLAILLASLASGGELLNGTGEPWPPGINTVAGFIRTLTFLFTGTDAITIMDGPIWSLRLEVILYVITALIASAFVSKGLQRLALVVATALLLAPFVWRLSFATPSAALFGCGGLTAIYFGKLRRIPLAWSGFALAVALATPLVLPGLTDDTPLSLIYQSLLGVPLAVFVCGLAATSSRAPTAAEKLLTKSGDWSYSLYILHWPLLVILYGGLQGLGWMPANPAMKLALAASAFIAINVAVYFIALVAERPAYFAGIIRRIVRDRGSIATQKP